MKKQREFRPGSLVLEAFDRMASPTDLWRVVVEAQGDTRRIVVCQYFNTKAEADAFCNRSNHTVVDRRHFKLQSVL
jgi:hypothetical protein